MVFSGLLGGSSSDRSVAKAKSITSPSTASVNSIASGSDAAPAPPPEYISDEAHLRPLDPEAPDLRTLNACLEALAAVFPNIQIDVFREMLCSFDGESRLALVADALLKNRVTWVKGRWRVADKDKKAAEVVGRRNKKHGEARLVPRAQVFKSAEYKDAVKALAYQEFKGLSKGLSGSTINAVLAEFNHSYLEARPTLVELKSKSWRSTFTSFTSIFSRRRAVTSTEIENHPLVIWKSSGQGSIVPCLKSTGNAELDRELFNELIAPLRERIRTEQDAKDRKLAFELNNKEAEEAEATIECACCFTESAFEEFTSCNTEDAHMICFRCVQHCIQEAIFGQGWQRSIDKETGTLRCPAVVSTGSSECKGCISQHDMYRAMLEETKGAEILHKLEQRLADHSLVSSNLPLIRCPFCSYAEVDDIYVPAEERQLRLRADNIYNLVFVSFVLLCIATVAIPFVLPYIIISSLLYLMLSSRHTFGDYVVAQFKEALARHRRRRRGLKFTCQQPDCRRSSCLGCHKEWVDIHVCHESTLVALRTQVEQAMSMAIKRVCPRCNTSFVKESGCNKLTCTCGYKMCYVCRKNISGSDGPDAGYQHFCQHFRPLGYLTQCTECNKCNLWEKEDTEQVLQQAKDEAERKWRETEGRELSGAEKVYLETGLAAAHRERGIQKVVSQFNKGGGFMGEWPTVAQLCDFLVENLLV
ncbi:putative E3 ubiquitin-protein ligase ARI4 [Diplogelasinospora grovesii]|uniref:E3 ubiquitin-protein ligase ARI4 n=1 Tax=Diplogelasinospora grovesii TaxID=303347 RepID=A0AAN6S4S7_9PEZI|nr:putative E3 ubiquitin-protein ligase ARI4 [Diplogelasinospora grovesii]